MDNAWMDLYGETPDDKIAECYGCGHLLHNGECINPECKLCERVCPYCNGTTLDLASPEDGGTYPHCFRGIIK